MTLKEAFQSARQGNFVTHHTFSSDQSMHYWNGRYYYEDGAVVTYQFLNNEEWPNRPENIDGWCIKFPKDKVNTQKLKSLHQKFGHLMISSESRSYEEVILKDDQIGGVNMVNQKEQSEHVMAITFKCKSEEEMFIVKEALHNQLDGRQDYIDNEIILTGSDDIAGLNNDKEEAEKTNVYIYIFAGASCINISTDGLPDADISYFGLHGIH
jgi:hypothetical protein